MTEPFSFFSPVKVNSGRRALEHLPFELDGMNAGRPLILLDPEGTRTGLDRVVEEAFADSGLVLGFFGGVPAAPDLSLIRDLAGLCRERGFDALIAVGSGAVTDTAKALNIVLSGAPEDLETFAGVDRIPGRLRPLVAVPGTGGTGYEVSRFAFLGDRVYSSRRLMPDLVVVDPRMLVPRNRVSTAAGALAAWAHAVEACFTAPANPLTEAYAGGALALLREALVPGIGGTADENARVALANAAVFAACAFSNAPPGTAHVLGEAVALETGLAAGVAMALLLPPVAARLAGTGRDLSRLLLPLAGMDRFAQTAEAERSSAVPALLGRLLEEVLEAAGGDLPRDLKQAGLARERLEELAGSVAGKTPDAAAGALTVLEAAWAGKRTA
jgi:alcohol dehydrogenase